MNLPQQNWNIEGLTWLFSILGDCNFVHLSIHEDLGQWTDIFIHQ